MDKENVDKDNLFEHSSIDGIKETSDLLNTKQETCKIHGVFWSHLLPFTKKTWSTCPVCSQEDYDTAIDEKNKDRTTERQHAIITKRLKDAQIPNRFKKSYLTNFTAVNDNQKKSLTQCQNYAKKYDKETELPESIFLVGSVGTGKTHLAIGILRHVIIKKGSSGIYTTVGRMVRDIRSSYRQGSKETEQELIDKYINYPLLILDEIGIQTGTENEKNLLFEVINGRYENYKPTVLISNLDFNGVKFYLGERSIDRLISPDGIVEFDWGSYRRKERKS